MSKHAALWLDHHEARIFHVLDASFEEATLHAPSHHHKHPKGAEGAHAHPDDNKRFFEEIAATLRGYDEVLVLGPSTSKLQFIKFVHKHDHALEPKIVGVETVDHPTDRQIVAYARHYFKAADQLR